MRLLSKLKTCLLLLQWQLFKQKHRDDPITAPHPDSGVNPEQFLQTILSEHQGQSFLEIGIGPAANLARLRLISRSGIRYTGCDFKGVCELHEHAISTDAAIDLRTIRFLPNDTGTYAWTLFELLRNGETFDVIYLDGHHTFYVDCPALVLAHYLLKPGGVLMLDDIQWTLDFVKSRFLESFSDWRFYKGVYNFADYDARQQSIPHIGVLAETILIEQHGYAKLPEYSIAGWWALRKPAAVPSPELVGAASAAL